MDKKTIKKMPREQLIEERIKKPLLAGEEFYNLDALYYKGVSTEGIPYSEIIAEWLYENYDKKESLIELLRQNSDMKDDSDDNESLSGPIHDPKKVKYNEKSGRNEEKIAIRLFQLEELDVDGDIGCTKMKVVDYQVPVHYGESVQAEGKVDLVLLDRGQIVIGELKDEDSQETLLRAVVEAKTYQSKIQKCNKALKRFVSCYAPEFPDTKWLQPAILLCAGAKSRPCADFDRMMRNGDSWLRKLISRWNIKIYLVAPDGAQEGKPYQERYYHLEKIF